MDCLGVRLGQWFRWRWVRWGGCWDEAVPAYVLLPLPTLSSDMYIIGPEQVGEWAAG